MITLTIYHDCKPSKVRDALPLIRYNGFEQKKIEYIKQNFLRFGLYYILKKLEIFLRDIFRHFDKLFKELNLQTRQLSNDNIFDLIMQFPKLLESPILVLDFLFTVRRLLKNIVYLYQAVKI